MRLFECENEDAIDLLADIIVPASEIFSDKELAKAVRSNKPATEWVKIALKSHKKSVIELLAALEGVPVEEYKCTVITLTRSLLDLLQDKELLSFFQSQGQMMGSETSGSVTETTKETEEK